MEYVYAAMLLHKAGKEINADSIKKVLEAAGVTVDDGRIKALIAALEGVNIDDAIAKASVAVAAPAAAAAAPAGEAPKEKKEEKAKEEKVNEEQAAAGLGSLFG